MKYLDKFLNGITMYKLALYSLLVSAVFAVLFGFFGVLPYSGGQLLASVLFFVGFCYGINLVFVNLFNAPATAESSVITALILFFIMSPAQNLKDLLAIFLICLAAMASKYVLAINKKHIFNPVVAAAVIFGFSNNYGAIWWVANIYMLPIVCVAGFLLVKKTRRFPLFFACVFGFLITYFYANGLSNILISLKTIAISWPLIFFATIMLTEPSTLPPKRIQQIIYGFLIGLFLGVPFKLFGNIYATPEIILAIGNIGSYAVSLKRKAELVLEEKIQLAKDCYEFVFSPGEPLVFEAGQYMEWSLPHEKQDNRGMRRYFTVASAPNEKEVRVGIRFAEKGSSFKNNLLQMQKGDSLYAGNISGDFVLPRGRSLTGEAKNKKSGFVFIAGGIGITPFVSIIRDLMNKGEKTDAVIFYANKTEDIPYADLLKNAEEKIGLKTVYLIGNEFLNEQLLTKYVPYFQNKIFYLSGPNAMVDNYKNLIKNMGVKRSKIKTDYFPGF